MGDGILGTESRYSFSHLLAEASVFRRPSQPSLVTTLTPRLLCIFCLLLFGSYFRAFYTASQLVSLAIDFIGQLTASMESLRLWLALTPKQVEDFNKGQEVQPDEYSNRFGLRTTPTEAVERAQYFMD
eukprot:s582_g24.t1